MAEPDTRATEDRLTPALRTVSEVVVGVAADLSVDDVLQRLVESARELAGARYAALGLPDGVGGFRRFLTSGMSDELISSLGPLPRQHGVLGAMLESREPYSTGDIHEHPRFRGWWPDGHPDMRSFLGVPIVSREGVVGAFYLTEKLEAPDFTHEDEELITLLAAHAAIAIANARLHEETRELSIVAERNRLALDLHDAVSQKLFGLVLEAEAAATVLERDPEAARERVGKLQVLARDALEELRSLVFELRPPDLARDGLAGALRKHVEVLRRLGNEQVELAVSGEPDGDEARDAEAFRIAQEALQNALKHAHAGRIAVRVGSENGRLLLEVEDDGVGFDPAAPEVRSRRLGLTSMEERARRVGAELEIRSAPGGGTTVRLETRAG
ncbi:MAG: GAF domain-containing protein [Gaiellaceae bacterium]